MRDKDSIDCDVCGATLIEWDGGVIYSSELVQRAEWPVSNDSPPSAEE